MTRRFGTPAAIACALLWGLQFALLMPVVAVLLVELYGATSGQVGLLMALSNAVAFVMSLVVPRYADRTGDHRRPMVVAGLAGFVLALAFALAPNLLVVGGAMILLTGPAGVGMPLYWGYLRQSGSDPRQMIRLRSLFSVAWVAGPPAATIALGLWGPRVVPWLVAMVCVAALAASLALLRGAGVAPHEPAPHAGAATPGGVVIVALAAFCLLQATNSAVTSTMTLIVGQHLGIDVVWGGLALGLAAGLEVPALLLLGRLMGRWSSTTLIAIGCIAGIAYYAGMAVATGPATLLALQVLNAWFFATIAGVGLTWFQDLVPGAALAAGLFANTARVGAIMAGGLVAASAVMPGGFGAVLLVNAVVCLLVLVVILLLGRRIRRGPRRRRLAGADPSARRPGKAPMKILITAFDPFGGEPLNPALEAVCALDDVIAGAEVVKVEVPTVFGRAIDVATRAIDEHRPDAVLCVGQAGGRFGVTPERVAINVDDARIPDNDGNQPLDVPIVADGPAAWFATLPVKAMVQAIRDAGLPSSLSNSAGTFVCNHLMYGVLHHLARTSPATRAGFIHVPFVPSQVVDKPEAPSMASTDITRALAAAVEAIVIHDADIVLDAGTTH